MVLFIDNAGYVYFTTINFKLGDKKYVITNYQLPQKCKSIESSILTPNTSLLKEK